MNETVTRFLSWNLPKDFAPDGGVDFTPPANNSWWPLGTNLLNAEQAEQMITHIAGEGFDDYLKDRETIAECLKRNRDDAVKVLGLLAKEKELSEKQANDIEQLKQAAERMVGYIRSHQIAALIPSEYFHEIDSLLMRLDKAG